MTTTSDDSSLFEFIRQDIPDLTDELFEKILDLGINDMYWGDAYVSTLPTDIRVEATFSRNLCRELGYLDDSVIPEFITCHIDWQAVWDEKLIHDYFTIESQGSTHFFSNDY